MQCLPANEEGERERGTDDLTTEDVGDVAGGQSADQSSDSDQGTNPRSLKSMKQHFDIIGS